MSVGGRVAEYKLLKFACKHRKGWARGLGEGLRGCGQRKVSGKSCKANQFTTLALCSCVQGGDGGGV